MHDDDGTSDDDGRPGVEGEPGDDRTPPDDPPSGSPLHDRVADQFSYRGERADVWRAFDRFLVTGAYLNLGYSPWYLPHVVGSSQRRLAAVVGRGLADRLEATAGVTLVDVGCGRGGPAAVLADSYGFDVTGVDLVPYNVAAARRNAASAGVPAEFVVGDAARLPIAAGSFDAAAAIDALVYVPDGRAVFAEFARVVRAGGVVAVTDLLARDGLDDAAREAVDAFAGTWDTARIAPASEYLDDLRTAGLVVEGVRDLSPHSVGRFRKWTRLYLAAADGAPGLASRVVCRLGLDADRITGQVRAAHEALPHLEHVLVFATVE